MWFMVVLHFDTIVCNIYRLISSNFIFTTRWAQEGRLALWFGIVNTSPSFGYVLSFFIFPHLSAKSMWNLFWAGYTLSLLIFLSSFIASAIDYSKRSRFQDSKAILVYISWTSIKRIKLSMWVLIFIFMFYFSSLFNFFIMGSDILQNTGYYNSPQIASIYLSIPFIVNILATPYFSWLQNYHGRTLILVSISAFATSMAQFCLLANAHGIFRFYIYLQSIVSV